MLRIANNILIPSREIEIRAIRSQGAGGQNVNKVASAVHLRFDIRASSLPELYRQRLLSLNDRRISRAGIITIKAQEHRSQEQNRAAALERLLQLLRAAGRTRRKRRPTAPTAASRVRRIETKVRHGRQKRLRAERMPRDPE